MCTKSYYLREISRRGDERGGSGGLLSLLEWSGKTGLYEVTQEEARLFLEETVRRSEALAAGGNGKPITE